MGEQKRTLVQSSPMTRRWLEQIKSEVEKKLPSLTYEDKKYYCPFKNPETNRNFVQLNPLVNHIRLFTKLPPDFDNDLAQSPATGNYNKSFPSLFVIKSENDKQKAIRLIIESYRLDGGLATL
jgi:hypothetical protein